MRKTWIFVPVFLFTSVSFIACSVDSVPVSTVPANNLLRVYEARCADNGTTYISVKFLTEAKFDTMNNPFGKAVELDAPSTITFNGQPMEFKKGFWSGVVYKAESKEWPGTFTFAWTDSKGRKHVDTATMDRIAIKDNWLVRVGGRDMVVWEGSPVRPGETVSIHIGKKDTNLNYSTNQVGARMIHAHDLPPGIDMLGLERTDIDRTLTRRIGKELMDETEYGVFIKIVYNSVDF